MMKLDIALTAIDTANAADPNQEDGKPAALLYGQRMSEELERLYPEATDPLKIAARGQHIERWITPRQSYPDGKAGYHAWRRNQARHHADRVVKSWPARVIHRRRSRRRRRCCARKVSSGTRTCRRWKT